MNKEFKNIFICLKYKKILNVCIWYLLIQILVPFMEKNRKKNLNASLQKEDKLTDTCAVTMFGSLPSIFSITSWLPSFSLQEVINLLTFGAFFVWHKRTKACFANGSIFTTDKSSLFPDLKLEILPKFKRDKIKTEKSEGCQKFSVFLFQMFSTKNTVET